MRLLVHGSLGCAACAKRDINSPVTWTFNATIVREKLTPAEKKLFKVWAKKAITQSCR